MLTATEVDGFLARVESVLNQATSLDDLYKRVVDSPFDEPLQMTMLGIGFLTLVLENPKTKTIDRIAMTANYLSQGARDVTVVPFEKLIVPHDMKGNFVAEAIRSGRYQQTNDWNNLLTPVLKPEEARLNQAGAGIASSFVYPLKIHPGGAIIFQYFVTIEKIGREHHDFMFRYCKLVSRVISQRMKAES